MIFSVTQLIIMSYLLVNSRIYSLRHHSFFGSSRRLLRTRSAPPKNANLYSGHLVTHPKTTTDDSSEELVTIKNTQRKFPINVDLLRDQTKVIMKILNIEDFRVEMLITSEAQIKEFNGDLRDKDKSTDVISVRNHKFTAPEIIKHLGVQRHIGKMIISPAYVYKQCMQDKEDNDNGELELEEDAGCSREMATKFTVDERLPLLIIHSILHMIGHDHETDRDWEIMTKREDEVIKQFYEHYKKSEAS